MIPAPSVASTPTPGAPPGDRAHALNRHIPRGQSRPTADLDRRALQAIEANAGEVEAGHALDHERAGHVRLIALADQPQRACGVRGALEASPGQPNRRSVARGGERVREPPERVCAGAVRVGERALEADVQVGLAGEGRAALGRCRGVGVRGGRSVGIAAAAARDQREEAEAGPKHRVWADRVHLGRIGAMARRGQCPVDPFGPRFDREFARNGSVPV
jgi:hypothetical protein